MSKLSKKIDLLAEQNGVSVFKACKEMNIPITFYSDLKAGKAKSCSLERAGIIANYFNVPVSFLLSDSDELPETKIPVYGTVPAGIPLEAIEDVVDYEEITSEMASKGKYIALKIKGDSMLPRIVDGDVVIVRLQDDADTGDTVIVMINGGEATCKKIKKTPEGVFLLPNNPAFEPLFYSTQQIIDLPVRVIGKVVELRGAF